jgi:hypothetical protein
LRGGPQKEDHDDDDLRRNKQIRNGAVFELNALH